MSNGPLLEITFEAEVIQWRGPAPFFFVTIPKRYTSAIKRAARIASYGWGVVPVTVEIGAVGFTTSLFPRDGGYLVPLKNAVREEAAVVLGDMVRMAVTIAAR
ncbi:MAG: DUF1905 domain-containing protein [Candidatus Sphingomonas colombiensis]|nr:DUF1905 domain-containing protein [Sphingomonas sp.]WEK42333.1 MAG: DUF1905 domain-containing protein [Sphingomonas sp.]